MRGKQRGQQTIYLAVIEKTKKYDSNGDWTGEYNETETKGQSYRCSVSVSDTATILNAGIVPNYERLLTFYKGTNLNEGDRLFIDSDTKSDYVITQKITTYKGQVFVYGIKRIV